MTYDHFMYNQYIYIWDSYSALGKCVLLFVKMLIYLLDCTLSLFSERNSHIAQITASDEDSEQFFQRNQSPSMHEALQD